MSGDYQHVTPLHVIAQLPDLGNGPEFAVHTFDDHDEACSEMVRLFLSSLLPVTMYDSAGVMLGAMIVEEMS